MYHCSVHFICRQGYVDWKISVVEMYKFIAVLFARGVVAKGFPLKELWSKEWGPQIFSKLLSRNRFYEILKLIRFDDKRTRRRRLRGDRFALFSEIWDRFICNSKRFFKPNAYLTIDEQLYPTKVRCRFLQFMPNKPDKFGIKFWLLVDCTSKYVIDGFPYLGKDEERPKTESLPENVVKRLMRDHLDLGYNVTMDNFFTSKKLADYLKENKTSILGKFMLHEVTCTCVLCQYILLMCLGTIRNNRRELPNNLSNIMKKTALHDSISVKSDGCILTSYKCKIQKYVCLLSTLHTSVECTGEKRKPSTVVDYNNTKYGVDVVDQMARIYSCKLSSRRWPVQVYKLGMYET